MTETEKGRIGENLVINALSQYGHKKVKATKYHDCYDVLVDDICKIEVKYSNCIDGHYSCLLPEMIRSDFTIIVCEGWKTFVIPSFVLKVQYLQINKNTRKFNMYEDRLDLIGIHIKQMEVLKRSCNNFDAAMDIIGE